MKPDKALGAWFKARCANQGLTVTAVGKLMGLDKSAVSRMFHRQRKIEVPELHRLAEILCLMPEEIEQRMGVKSKRNSPRIAGRINAAGELERVKNGDLIEFPPRINPETEAFKCEKGIFRDGKYADWVFFAGPKTFFQPEMSGKIGFFQPEKSKKWIFGQVENDFSTGKNTISGAEKYVGLNLKYARLILWAKIGAE